MVRRQRNEGIPFNDLYGGKFVGKKFTKRRSKTFSVWTFVGVTLENLKIRRK